MSSEPFDIVRRRFLTWVSGAGAFFAAHGITTSQVAGGESPTGSTTKTRSRIRALELMTATPLSQMLEFYHRQLGMTVIEQNAARLTVYVGETDFTFLPTPDKEPGPFYHFAFNIPENKILAARQWQLERTPLLPIPRYRRDKEFPDDVVNYRHWNAHSMFFFDPAGNVVEYIARHDLDNAAAGEFGSQHILCASEIAFVLDDVLQTAAKLREVATVPQYKQASKPFAALGDDQRLLLMMKRGRVISFSAPEKKAVDVFPINAEIFGDENSQYAFPEFPYHLTVKK